MAYLRPVRPEPPRRVSSSSWIRWLLARVPSRGGAFPALGFRDFRLFWFGQLISLTGTWIQTVAQQWLVLKLTDSPFALGLVTTIQFIPLLVLALFTGAIADRVPKRNLILVTQVAAGLLALILGLLVSTGQVRYWHVLVIAALLGTVNAFYNPARQAFIPELVDRESLLNAVALNSAIFNGARVVGPAVGGILVATIGLSLNFYLNAASYLAVIAGLLLIRPVARATRAQEPLVRNVAEGLRYIFDTPVVYTILILIGAASLFGLNFTTLMPLFARYVLNIGSSGFGFLMAAMGLGSLAGAITLAFVSSRDLARRFIYGGIFAFSAIEIVFAFSRQPAISAALLFLVGLSSTLFTTSANTRILSLTPQHLQGRVMSVYGLMFLGMTPFGSFLSGVVAQRWGAPVAAAGGAAITLVLALAVFAYHQSVRAPVPQANSRE